MKTIIAIGGGENFEENLPINRRIVELSQKQRPKVLFIPTASGDAVSYFESLDEHFSDLDCVCDVLYLIRERPSFEIISQKILRADIIYVGGGNTFRMMKIWRKTGVDQLLIQAYENGTVLSGLSAGAICWFRYGNSDSRRFNNPEADLIKVSGLNLVNALYCPHYDAEADRKPDLRKMMKKTSGVVAIAVDNCCAIEIVNDTFRIIDSKPMAQAYKIYWKGGTFFEERIEKLGEYQALDRLIYK